MPLARTQIFEWRYLCRYPAHAMLNLQTTLIQLLLTSWISGGAAEFPVHFITVVSCWLSRTADVLTFESKESGDLKTSTNYAAYYIAIEAHITWAHITPVASLSTLALLCRGWRVCGDYVICAPPRIFYTSIRSTPVQKHWECRTGNRRRGRV